MTEPAPGELDLFGRFKEFLGGCTWAVMIARASAETRSQIAPGEIEQWMRRWFSSSDPRDNAHPDSFFGLCRRQINRFIETGRAGRFTVTGFVGAEHKTFGAEIWWAVHRIDFCNHRLLLTSGATIVGVRITTTSPQNTAQQPGTTDGRYGLVRQQRRALGPLIKTENNKGESTTATVNRLVAEKKLKLPGNGSHENLVRELVREVQK
jgi:hypothetical protein